MPGLLVEGATFHIPELVVDAFKVVNHAVQDDDACGEHYINIYIVYGNIIDGVFQQYFNPMTGEGLPVAHVKLEDGHHPMVHTAALNRCSVCGAWLQLVPCAVVGCEEAIMVPYDGFTRACSWGASDPTYYTDGPVCPGVVTKKALYEFLRNECVPESGGDLSVEIPIIDTESWE